MIWYYNREKIVFYYLPLFCQMACMYNLLLSFVGIKYLYFALMLLGCGAMCFYKNVRKENLYTSTIKLYIILVMMSSYFHVMFNNENWVTITLGMFIYILPVSYWLIYYLKYRDYFVDIIIKLKFHVLIIAILGLIQFYISPKLFGLLEGSRSTSVEWAGDSDLDSYLTFFRASSILVSPQILGLFMVLYSILYFEVCQRSKMDFMYLALFLIAGAHSGNKSFFLISFLYLGYWIMKKPTLKVVTVTITILLLGFSVLYEYREEVGFINRLLDYESVINSEKNGRLAIYSSYIQQVTIGGEGAGSTQNIMGSNLKHGVAESYLIQLLYELGPVLLLLFCLLFFFNYLLYSRLKINITLFFVFFSMFFVHAFVSPIFFIFWGVFFLKKCNIKYLLN